MRLLSDAFRSFFVDFSIPWHFIFDPWEIFHTFRYKACCVAEMTSSKNRKAAVIVVIVCEVNAAAAADGVCVYL